MNREEGIKIIAYQIWEKGGHTTGNDVQDWLKAETIWQQKNETSKMAEGTVLSAQKQQIDPGTKTKTASSINRPQANRTQSPKMKP